VDPEDIVSTHVHVGAFDMNMEEIQGYFRKVGYELADKIQVFDYIKLFGRRFNLFADCNFDEKDKFFWINTVHTNTVEFRLPRFVSYRQATAVIDCCLDWMEAAVRKEEVGAFVEAFKRRLAEVEA
ncbi:hypothetical protein, partial [Candidatus Caldatribacterium sp.]|uniref:hypothetical protein n=1 Tax=Candidatus Caldatribacterium sp. TaxID=2282143 RepID=UPI0038449AEE|nr:hypothetical protein [Candidatus Caldatribacterium sp.]